MSFPKCEREVLQGLYGFTNGLTRSELSSKIHKKETGLCARLKKLEWYIGVIGKRLDPETEQRVNVYALNKRGIKAVVKMPMPLSVAA